VNSELCVSRGRHFSIALFHDISRLMSRFLAGDSSELGIYRLVSYKNWSGPHMDNPIFTSKTGYAF